MPMERVEAVRLTEFTAMQPEQRERLFQLVKAGQDSLWSFEDCRRCEAFLDVENPCKVLALEVWAHAEARAAAAAQIPSEVVRSAMAIMDGAPVSRDLTRPVSLGPSPTTNRPDAKLSLVILTASVREHRFGAPIAAWFRSVVMGDARFKVDTIDLAELNLPAALPGNPADLADPAKRPSALAACTRALGDADTIVIVTPEYNHGMPASLKHFIDWHILEWRAKPVACVGYGGMGGGIRAIENVRQVLAELHATVIRDAVTLSSPWDLFGDDATLLEPDEPSRAASTLLDHLAWWGYALRTARTDRPYSELFG